MKQPTIYEINTPVFLHEITQRVGRKVTLAEVPDEIWDEVAGYGEDIVWFMGVWKRSHIARQMAYKEEDIHNAFPGVTDLDIIGSAYSIQDYTVDDSLGGNGGLAVARAKLKQRGIDIILDYVPNHVAIDHVWATEHPDYFVSGTAEELHKDSSSFVAVGEHVIAKAKDPNFAPWSDVIQVNAFSAGLRNDTANTLKTIASMCDGVRCDMAMLMVNEVFESTWKRRAGERPVEEYWPAIIAAVKQLNPSFLFLAEVYWDMEGTLVEQGFDYCYDKALYDELLDGSIDKIKEHLHQPVEQQKYLMRFIENHDEERAAKVFTLEQHRAAAFVSFTLPGIRLFHQGQFEGARAKVPVHLSRRLDEMADENIELLYKQLTMLIKTIDFENDTWQLIETHSGLFHRESKRILAWTWSGKSGSRLFMVNYGEHKTNTKVSLLGNKKITLDPWQTTVIKLS